MNLPPHTPQHYSCLDPSLTSQCLASVGKKRYQNSMNLTQPICSYKCSVKTECELLTSDLLSRVENAQWSTPAGLSREKGSPPTLHHPQASSSTTLAHSHQTCSLCPLCRITHAISLSCSTKAPAQVCLLGRSGPSQSRHFFPKEHDTFR